MKILIRIGGIEKIEEKELIELEAELNNSETAKIIFRYLPIESKVNLWGDEIYFRIPVSVGLEEGYIKEEVNIGDICYWPDGECFCIFFGPTPISSQGKILPASRVNLIGKVVTDVDILKNVRDGEKIEVKESKKLL